MAKATINAGICGFHTVVETHMEEDLCKVSIQSDCPAVQRLAEALTEVNPYAEISFRRKLPRTIEMGIQHCAHAACPVPIGIIKAVEVEANLALPADVSIIIERTD